MKASGSGAVMAHRVEPPDSLDFFPTPPWATRALMEHVLTPADWQGASVWEPAAGEGHMAYVLSEYFQWVSKSDVHDYGKGGVRGSFVGEGLDVASWDSFGVPLLPDWVITNPPFNLAIEFAERGLREAQDGVALLLRSVWMESKERYERLFRDTPPTTVAVFSERVPMTKGRWDPEASTATSYAWFVWRKADFYQGTKLVWIPPGQRQLLEHSEDRIRFAVVDKSQMLLPCLQEVS